MGQGPSAARPQRAPDLALADVGDVGTIHPGPEVIGVEAPQHAVIAMIYSAVAGSRSYPDEGADQPDVEGACGADSRRASYLENRAIVRP